MREGAKGERLTWAAGERRYGAAMLHLPKTSLVLSCRSLRVTSCGTNVGKDLFTDAERPIEANITL